MNEVRELTRSAYKLPVCGQIQILEMCIKTHLNTFLTSGITFIIIVCLDHYRFIAETG